MAYRWRYATAIQPAEKDPAWPIRTVDGTPGPLRRPLERPVVRCVPVAVRARRRAPRDRAGLGSDRGGLGILWGNLVGGAGRERVGLVGPEGAGDLVADLVKAVTHPVGIDGQHAF